MTDEGASTLVVDQGTHRVTASNHSLDPSPMKNRFAPSLGVVHKEPTRRSVEHTPVTHLAATLGIEGRAVENDSAFLAVHELHHRPTAVLEREDGPLVGEGLVARKMALLTFMLETIGAERGSPTGPFALFAERFLEPLDVDRPTPLTQHVLRQIKRKAVGVGEAESHPPGKNPPRRALELGFEEGKPFTEGQAKTLFLGPQADPCRRLAGREGGIGLAHERHHGRNESVEEELVGTELDTVTDGAPKDSAQNVAPPFVARKHAVGA